MLVIDGGSVTEANEVQCSKASLPMLVNDGGSVTEANEVQPQKA